MLSEIDAVPLYLSPMSGVTDLAFRLVAREIGADETVSEFTSASALARDQAKAWDRLETDTEETPFIAQIFGGNEDDMLQTAKMLEGKADVLDLNFGCPAKKVTRTCAGAALMGEPDRLVQMASRIVQSVNIPVSAKLRLGVDSTSVNVVELSRRLESAGVFRLCIHGRTLVQRYKGSADWSTIAAVVEAVDIPVIANGDIVDADSAAACLEATGASGLMVGRAAIGAPHIMWRIKKGLGWPVKNPPWGPCSNEWTYEDERAAKAWAFGRYVDISRQKGTLRLKWLRRHAVSFTKGIQGGSELRRRMHDIGNDLAALIDACSKSLSPYDSVKS